jgi:hypothetical protein
MNSGKILFFTDRYKVSAGYEPAFGKLLRKSGINRSDVVTVDIYGLVDSPIRKYGNETTWKYDKDKTLQIEQAFANRFNIIKPKMIVVADPACLCLFTNNLKMATLDKMRGGVYEYEGVPVIITFPITAIHQRVDQRIVENEDGEKDTQQPYRVQQGAWILGQDWAKVGRFFHEKQRVLPPFRYSICRTIEDCFAAKRFLDSCVLIAADIETGCFPAQITCSGYTGLTADGVVRSFVIPFYDAYKTGGVYWDSEEDHVTAYCIMRDINANPVLKTMQNGGYDSSYSIRDRCPYNMYLLDSMHLWYSLYSELPKTLDFITSILLDNFQYWKDDIKGIEDESEDSTGDMEQYWRYNALDCYNTLFNTLYLLLLMQNNESMQFNYNQVFMRNLSGIQMSMRGVKADFARREEHRVNLEKQREEALDTFRYMIDDPEFNVESPAQKSSLLYDFLGIRERNSRGRFITPGLKGKEASRSSGALALKLAKADHPFFRLIIEAMEAAMEPGKQISNVCNMKLFTDRFRTAYNAAGTETERFSSKKSNFWDGGNSQNIRKTYRDWMVADEGCIFLDIDYSQSDDVFMAYESQDPDKIAVVESGRDAHAVNGELFFKMPYDEIVAGKKAGDPRIVHPITGIRQIAKKVVHGTNFQMAAMTLYVTAGREPMVAAALYLGFADAESWDQERLVNLCAQLMAQYRKKYRRLTNKEYYAEIAKALKTQGMLTNAFGVTRRFLSDATDNGTQREATAFIGQSDTSSNMNRVQNEVNFGYIPERFRDGPNPDFGDTPRLMTWDSHGFRFHLQVHDNFLSQLDLSHPRWKEAAHNLLHVMNRPIIIHGREVRIRAEAEVGLKWGKGMIEWDGKDVHDLDRIVTSLFTANKLKEQVHGQ